MECMWSVAPRRIVMGMGGKKTGNKMTQRMKPGEGNGIKAGHGTRGHL